MSIKKITVSDDNSKYKEIASSSVYVDNNKLYSSKITATTSSYIGKSGILQSHSGTLKPFWTTSSIASNYQDVDNNPLTPSNLSGCLIQFRDDESITDYKGFAPNRIEAAFFSGDINGNLTVVSPIKVVSVANVSSGTLDTKFGGTGTGSFEPNSVVTLSGSVSAISNLNKTIIVNNSKNWDTQDKSVIEFQRLTSSVIYLFTGSVGTSSASSYVQYNWTPPAGTRFIRVICQGGGGGGGSGWQSTLQANTYGGGGGGGGGFLDVTYDAFGLSFPINITAGYGGLGGPSNFASGASGGDSSFGTYLYSYGGSGGARADSSAGGAGGNGYTVLGASGGKGQNATVSAVGTSISSTIGAPGGGGGAGNITTGNSAGSGGGSLSDLAGGSGGSTNSDNTRHGQNGNSTHCFYFEKYFLNNTTSSSSGGFPQLKCTGGGGGAGVGSSSGASISGGNGGSATFGAGGGGGGGKNVTSPSGAGACGIGGNGGKGYVLIICT